MSRRGGTWARVDESIHLHEKTLGLATALEGLGVPAEWSTDVAVAQVHRLACWCLRESESGRIGHLNARALAAVLQWPDPTSAPALLSAWHDSGFVDYGGTARARLHDFWDYAAGLLKDRERKRSARSPRNVPGQSDAAPRTRARASESGSRKPEDTPHTPPPGGEGEGVAAQADLPAIDPQSADPPEPDPVAPDPRTLRADGLVRLFREICPKHPHPDEPLDPKLVRRIERELRSDPELANWQRFFGTLATLPRCRDVDLLELLNRKAKVMAGGFRGDPGDAPAAHPASREWTPPPDLTDEERVKADEARRATDWRKRRDERLAKDAEAEAAS